MSPVPSFCDCYIFTAMPVSALSNLGNGMFVVFFFNNKPDTNLYRTCTLGSCVAAQRTWSRRQHCASTSDVYSTPIIHLCSITDSSRSFSLQHHCRHGASCSSHQETTRSVSNPRQSVEQTGSGIQILEGCKF